MSTSSRCTAFLVVCALLAGVAFRSGYRTDPPPHVVSEPPRLARDARLLGECHGGQCDSSVKVLPRHARRRQRRRERRAVHAVAVATSNYSIGSARLTSSFPTADTSTLQPRRKLPTPYALHLEYMAAHPSNRPEAGTADAAFAARRSPGTPTTRDGELKGGSCTRTCTHDTCTCMARVHAWHMCIFVPTWSCVTRW